LRTCGGRKRCIVRVCKTRARKSGAKKGSRKFKKLVKRYTKLHCKVVRKRVVVRRHRKVSRKIRKIARKLRTRVVRVKKIRVVKKRVLKRRVRNYCKRVAVRKCGAGRSARGCRRTIKRKIIKREKKFDRKLRTCGGRKRCIVRVCKTRARKSGAKKGTRKFKKLVKRYTKLHCKTRTVKRIRVKKTIARKILKRRVRTYCKRVAVRKCGAGNRSCIKTVSKKIKKRENKFEKKLASCGGKRSCIVRKCKARAVKKAHIAVAKREKKVYTKLVTKYTKLHCPPKTARVSVVVKVTRTSSSSGGRRR